MIHLPEWYKRQQPVDSQFLCLFEVTHQRVTKVMYLCHACIHESEGGKEYNMGNTAKLVSLMLRLHYGNRVSDDVFGRTGFGFPSEDYFLDQKWP